MMSAVIDGDFFPDELHNLFHNAAEVDYIAGVNDMDGHLFTGLDIPSINSHLLNTPMWVSADNAKHTNNCIWRKVQPGL